MDEVKFLILNSSWERRDFKIEPQQKNYIYLVKSGLIFYLHDSIL